MRQKFLKIVINKIISMFKKRKVGQKSTSLASRLQEDEQKE